MAERILFIGGGARDNALVWASQKRGRELLAAPGNPGIARYAKIFPDDLTDTDGLTRLGTTLRPDLTVVGPEDPLADGIVDRFEAEGLRIFGPRQDGARVESSKKFFAYLMNKAGAPQPETWVCEEEEYQKALDIVIAVGHQNIVLKMDGLFSGKGVLLPVTVEEADEWLKLYMIRKKAGKAGSSIVIQRREEGQELSVTAVYDGQGETDEEIEKHLLYFQESRDHKAKYAGNKGPNTGGLGVISPVLDVTKSLVRQIHQEIMLPFIKAVKAEGVDSRGVFYCGLILTPEGPKALEMNRRFGSPEIETLTLRLRTDPIKIFNAAIDGTLDQIKVRFRKAPAACVVMATQGYPEDPQTGGEITGIEDIKDPDTQVFYGSTKLDDDGKLITDGGRVLTVATRRPTLPEAIEAAYQGTNKIHFEDKYVRDDIGGSYNLRYNSNPV